MAIRAQKERVAHIVSDIGSEKKGLQFHLLLHFWRRLKIMHMFDTQSSICCLFHKMHGLFDIMGLTGHLFPSI